jgi:hypothetical protein
MKTVLAITLASANIAFSSGTTLEDVELPIYRRASGLGLPQLLVRVPPPFCARDGESYSPGYIGIREFSATYLRSREHHDSHATVDSVDFAFLKPGSTNTTMEEHSIPIGPVRIADFSYLGIGPGSALQAYAGNVAAIWNGTQQSLVLGASDDRFLRECAHESFSSSDALRLSLSLEGGSVPIPHMRSSEAFRGASLKTETTILDNVPQDISDFIDSRLRSICGDSITVALPNGNRVRSYPGCTREMVGDLMPDIIVRFHRFSGATGGRISPSGVVEGIISLSVDDYMEFADGYITMKFVPNVDRSYYMGISLIQIPGINVRFHDARIDICDALN